MRYLGASNLLDEVFDDFDNDMFGLSPLNMGWGRHAQHCNGAGLLKTDISEKDDKYILDIDIPGFKKDDVKVKLDGGYLTISAERNKEESDKDKKDGHYIRQERYYGSVSRSWYVGDQLKQSDIHAKFNNGVLSLSIPKPTEEEELPEDDKYIAIEG